MWFLYIMKYSMKNEETRGFAGAYAGGALTSYLAFAFAMHLCLPSLPLSLVPRYFSPQVPDLSVRAHVERQLSRVSDERGASVRALQHIFAALRGIPDAIPGLPGAAQHIRAVQNPQS